MAFLFWGKDKKKNEHSLDEQTKVNNSDELPDEHEHVEEIAVDTIVPNRFQPRQIFASEKIDELAETIKTHGLLQPIILREYEPGKYEIIAGERRFRAIQQLNWKTVPAIVRQMSDSESSSMAVIENLQREGLTAIEEAEAYQRLLNINQMTQADLAQALGKSQSFIANKLRLLKLSRPVQQAILNRKISERHGRAIVRLQPEQQKQVLKQVLDQHLSVKETEKKVNKLLVPRMRPQNRPQIKGVAKDVRLAINTIKQSVKMVQETGINVQVEETTTDDEHKIIIEIPLKDKNQSKK